MTTTDVVVTGLGATTPLGGDVTSTWDAMLAGRSGVSALTQEWAAQLPVRIAAQLAVEPSEVLERVKLRRLDRSEAVALIAAQEAWADAFLNVMREIYTCIAAGPPYPALSPMVATFEDGFRASRIVDAILESAADGGAWTRT